MSFILNPNLTLESLAPRPDTVGKMLDAGIPVVAVLQMEAVSASDGNTTNIELAAFPDLPEGESKTEKLAELYGHDHFGVFPIASRRELRTLTRNRRLAKTALAPAVSDPTILTATVSLPNNL